MGTFGLSGTYFSVGALFAALTMYNQSALAETKPKDSVPPIDSPSKSTADLDLARGIWRGYGETYRAWSKLLSHPGPCAAGHLVAGADHVLGHCWGADDHVATAPRRAHLLG